MIVSVHNPDQYMASLRPIIAQGRKRIGLLVGAGATARIFPSGSGRTYDPGSLRPIVDEATKGARDSVTKVQRLARR